MHPTLREVHTAAIGRSHEGSQPTRPRVAHVIDHTMFVERSEMSTRNVSSSWSAVRKVRRCVAASDAGADGADGAGAGAALG